MNCEHGLAKDGVNVCPECSGDMVELLDWMLSDFIVAERAFGLVDKKTFEERRRAGNRRRRMLEAFLEKYRAEKPLSSALSRDDVVMLLKADILERDERIKELQTELAARKPELGDETPLDLAVEFAQARERVDMAERQSRALATVVATPEKLKAELEESQNALARVRTKLVVFGMRVAK